LGHEWSLRLKPSTFFSARASLPLFAKVVNDVRHTDRGGSPHVRHETAARSFPEAGANPTAQRLCTLNSCDGSVQFRRFILPGRRPKNPKKCSREIAPSFRRAQLPGILLLHRSPGGSLLACARRAPFSSRQLGSEVEPAVEEEVPDVAVDENPGRHFGPRWTLSQRNAFTSPAVTSVLRAHELIPRECLRDLACDLVRGRMRSDVDPDEVSWLFKIQRCVKFHGEH
jgi:hypothetical protein